MRSTFIHGIIPALITPMTPKEELDQRGLEKLIDDLIHSGVHGIFAVGTAGEFWALTPEEKGIVYERTVQFTRKRVPVYLGTCANSTREAILLSELAQKAGADCVSILTPSYIHLTQEQLFTHYMDIAHAVDIPILLYNLPARTGNTLSVDLVIRLAESTNNIVGIKDSSADFSYALELMERAPEGFRFLMGNDAMILPALIHGAVGAIAATANVVPHIAVAIYEHYRAGNLEAAKDTQQRLASLRKAFTLGTHPAMLKAGADMVGYAGGPPRAPVSPLTPSERRQLQSILKRIQAC